jgi:copper homeostasis protein
MRKLAENYSFAAVPDRNLVLEVCANGYDSALNAQRAGADRIELCDFLEAGGITPSPDVVSIIKDRLAIPVFVLIRPRPGNFVYTPAEIRKMKNEIAVCRQLGADGFVFGLLNHDGTVDTDRCAALVDETKGAPLTFHRAFDRVKEPFEAMEQIVKLGFQRILTSGLKDDCLDGADLISQLVAESAGRLTLLAGGGINESNFSDIIRRSHTSEFHFSAKTKKEDGSLVSDPSRIRALKEIAEKTFYAKDN